MKMIKLCRRQYSDIGNVIVFIHNEFSFFHNRQPTNPGPMSTNFYGLVGYDRVKITALIEESISIPDQHPQYPRCIPDASPIKPRSSRPTPILLADKSSLCTTSPTYSWCNYAQYRTNPDLYTWFSPPASNE